MAFFCNRCKVLVNFPNKVCPICHGEKPSAKFSADIAPEDLHERIKKGIQKADYDLIQHAKLTPTLTVVKFVEMMIAAKRLVWIDTLHNKILRYTDTPTTETTTTSSAKPSIVIQPSDTIGRVFDI